MATGSLTSFIPRREAQELGSLTIKGDAPSIGINSFSRGINVAPQQAVQFGAPYVSTQQTANFIASLGQFNDAIGRFGAAYNAYDTKQNELQGEADATTMDPELRSRLFNELKGNVDKAVEEGILPKAMHPVYKMNFIQTAAKNQTAQDLPAILDQERLRLTDAGATNIGGQLASKAQEYLNERYTDPLSRVAASKTAESIVLNHQTQFEAQRNANFDNQYFQQKDTDLQNNLDLLAQTYEEGGDENLRPSLYAQIGQRITGDKDPNGRISKAILDRAESMLARGVPPEQVKNYVEELGLNVQSGNGLWAKTSSGREAITKIQDQLLTFTSKRASLARDQRNDDYKTIELQSEADVNAAIRDGKIVTRADADALAASIHQKYPTIDKNIITLKVDTALKTVNNNAASEKSRPDLVAAVEDQIRRDPKKALATLDYFRNTKAGLTPSTIDELEVKAREADDEDKLTTAADGYKKLEQTIKDNVLPMFATKGAMSGLSEVDSKENAQKRDTVISSVDSFGRTALRSAIRRVMDEDAAGQNLRKTNPTAFKLKVDDAINEAIKRTTDFGLKSGEAAQKDKAFQTDSEELGEFTAPMMSIGNMVKDINAKNPSDITLEDKIALQRVPDLKNDLVNVMRYGVSEQKKKQAATAYGILQSYIGWSPDSIINGKDELGVPLDKKNIDPKNGLFFQNEQQYNEVMAEFNAVKKAGGNIGETKIAKMFKALEIPKEEQQRFIAAQQYYIAKRRIPSFKEILNDPTFPKGTKVDAGVEPSIGNPYPQSATPAPAPKPQPVAPKPQAQAPAQPQLSPDNPFKSELEKDAAEQQRLRTALEAKAANEREARIKQQNEPYYQNEAFLKNRDLQLWKTELASITEQMNGMVTKKGVAKKRLASQWETLNTRKSELENLISKNQK